MIDEIARIHVLALPHTSSSKRGVDYVTKLYNIVNKIGYIEVVERRGKIVGVMSGIWKLILTLAVDPVWQGKGVGRELIGTKSGKLIVYTNAKSVGFYKKMGFVQIMSIGDTIFLCRK